MIDIAAAGGGLDIDCSKRAMRLDTMAAIAGAAADSGKRPRVIFRNCDSLQVETLIRVSQVGQGCVIFQVR